MQELHPGPGLQPVLSGGDHGLVRLETRIDQSLTVTDLPNRDLPDLCRPIRGNHPDVGAVRPLLHGRGRDRQPVVPRGEEHSSINKFARPEPALRVGEVGAQLNRAGCLNDLIVNED
jgi:hypothetical protein